MISDFMLIDLRGVSSYFLPGTPQHERQFPIGGTVRAAARAVPNVAGRRRCRSRKANGWDTAQPFARSQPIMIQGGGPPDRDYSPRACLHHYWHMAQGNFDKYLSGETVGLKRYFYVLRPVLACCWVEQKTDAVPMEFARLLEAIVPASPLKSAIRELLENKQHGAELGEGPKIPIIHEFLELELQRISEAHGVCEVATTTLDELDALFRATLEEVWK